MIPQGTLRNEARRALHGGRNKEVWSQTRLGSDPGSACYVLGDLGQVSPSLWIFVSQSWKWRDNNLSLLTILRFKRLYKKLLAWFLAHYGHWIWIFFSPSGVGMPPKENVAKIIDSYAKHLTNNFSSMFRPIKNWLFCSCLTGGKCNKVHLWVRAVFVISSLIAGRKRLKVTIVPLLWISKNRSIFIFPKEENSIRQSGIWLTFLSWAFRMAVDRIFVLPLCFLFTF